MPTFLKPGKQKLTENQKMRDKKLSGQKALLATTAMVHCFGFSAENPRTFAIFGSRRKILADFHATKP